MGVPSMELPVLYALTYPDRVADEGVGAFDPVAASPLVFEPVRGADFPALVTSESARQALWLSLRTSFVATLLCVLFGVPMAMVRGS